MKKEFIKKIIQKLNKQDVVDIKVTGEKSKEPRTLEMRGSRKSFKPDVVAEFENKRDIFSVETKLNKSDLPDLITKWILFGLEARKHRGQFYVVVSKDNADKCQQIISSKQLAAQILTL